MHILFSVQSEYCSLGGHLLKSKTEDGVQGGSFSLSLPLCSITCSKYETTVASHPSLKPHRSWTLFFFPERAAGAAGERRLLVFV